MRCTIDCPDRGKCYLEHQAQCCPVYRVNCGKGQEAIKRNDCNRLYIARKLDKENPIPGAAEITAVYDDESIPAFMRSARIRSLKEVYA